MTASRIEATALSELGSRILLALGVPRADAELVSDSLVVAVMWGHSSQGMLRLAWYAARIRSGAMTAVTKSEVALDGVAIAVLDGREGLGQIMTNVAFDYAVARARQHGVGLVLVRKSNHFGTAAYWTRRIAASGCIGILTTNGSPTMAPWGGKVKASSCKPKVNRGTRQRNWSGCSRHRQHERARGKTYSALQRGEEIPATWAVNVDGLPTTDPKAAIDGILLPVGGHKGYGISFMMDVFSGC